IILIFMTYQAKIFLTFYRQSRETNRFLNSNNSVSRNTYFRILTLGCLEVMVTLPIGVIGMILDTHIALEPPRSPFYSGWNIDHSNWEPDSSSYLEVINTGSLDLFQLYFPRWSSVVLGCVIFALFGLTNDVRNTYRQAFFNMATKFTGWQPSTLEHSKMSGIVFGENNIHRDAKQQYVDFL